MIELTPESIETVKLLASVPTSELTEQLAYRLALPYYLEGKISSPMQLTLLSRINEIVPIDHEMIKARREIYAKIAHLTCIGEPIPTEMVEDYTVFLKHVSNEYPTSTVVFALDNLLFPVIRAVAKEKQNEY